MLRFNTIAIALTALLSSPCHGFAFLNEDQCYQANGVYYFVSEQKQTGFFSAAQQLVGNKRSTFAGSTWTYLDDTGCTAGQNSMPSGLITVSSEVNVNPCNETTGLVQRHFIRPAGCTHFAEDLSSILKDALSNVRSRANVGSQPTTSVYCPHNSLYLASAAESNGACVEMAMRINQCLSNPLNEAAGCIAKQNNCASFQCPYGTEPRHTEPGSGAGYCSGSEGCDRYVCCSAITTSDCMDFDCAAQGMVPAYTGPEACLVEGCSKWHCCKFE